MYEKYECGTVVHLDESTKGFNTLRHIGSSLPFEDFIIVVKAKDGRFYEIFGDFSKVEILEYQAFNRARSIPTIFIFYSQFRVLIDLAKKDNLKYSGLSEEVTLLIYRIGFITKDDLEIIDFIKDEGVEKIVN